METFFGKVKTLSECGREIRSPGPPQQEPMWFGGVLELILAILPQLDLPGD